MKREERKRRRQRGGAEQKDRMRWEQQVGSRDTTQVSSCAPCAPQSRAALPRGFPTRSPSLPPAGARPRRAVSGGLGGMVLRRGSVCHLLPPHAGLTGCPGDGVFGPRAGELRHGEAARVVGSPGAHPGLVRGGGADKVWGRAGELPRGSRQGRGANPPSRGSGKASPLLDVAMGPGAGEPLGSGSSWSGRAAKGRTVGDGAGGLRSHRQRRGAGTAQGLRVGTATGRRLLSAALRPGAVRSCAAGTAPVPSLLGTRRHGCAPERPGFPRCFPAAAAARAPFSRGGRAGPGARQQNLLLGALISEVRANLRGAAAGSSSRRTQPRVAFPWGRDRAGSAARLHASIAGHRPQLGSVFTFLLEKSNPVFYGFLIPHHAAPACGTGGLAKAAAAPRWLGVGRRLPPHHWLSFCFPCTR